MRTFQNHRLSQNVGHHRWINFFKGMTLMLLWASVMVLTAYGLTIDTTFTNSIQYIKSIVLTSDGTASGTTGIVLNGNGTASFASWVSVGGMINASCGHRTDWNWIKVGDDSWIYDDDCDGWSYQPQEKSIGNTLYIESNDNIILKSNSNTWIYII